MATDDTPPRNALILGIAVASVVTLGTLKFVFDSYYKYMWEEEVAAKAAPPMELNAAKLADQQRLTTSPVPIDRAMQEVAKSRAAMITPEQSTDDGPMIGWSKTPRAVAPAVLQADASAAVAGDGGASTTAAGDGGPSVSDAGAPLGSPLGAPATDAGKAPGAPGIVVPAQPGPTPAPIAPPPPKAPEKVPSKAPDGTPPAPGKQ